MLQSLTERAQARFPDREGFRVTETLVNELVRELRSPKNTPVRVATRYGVPVSLVRFLMQETPSPTSVFTKHSEDGWGRKSLRPYIVARKGADEAWKEEDKEAIEKARVEYDAGLVELCQGRDSDFIILYAVKRKKPAKRSYKYFEIIEEDEDEG